MTFDKKTRRRFFWFPDRAEIYNGPGLGAIFDRPRVGGRLRGSDSDVNWRRV